MSYFTVRLHVSAVTQRDLGYWPEMVSVEQHDVRSTELLEKCVGIDSYYSATAVSWVDVSCYCNSDKGCDIDIIQPKKSPPPGGKLCQVLVY